jgi:hypothetical protein
MTAQLLFQTIKTRMLSVISTEFIKSTRTAKGNTQVSERIVITKMKEIFDEMALTYEEAGSQQSKDFRNIGGIGLNIEIKKTDGTTICFNDTCPAEDIYYIIMFTGKEFKRKIEKNIPAQLCFLNGAEFLVDAPWIAEYVAELTTLKDKYARGANKKQLTGIMSVYPRPTFKADISSFLVRPAAPAPAALVPAPAALVPVPAALVPVPAALVE